MLFRKKKKDTKMQLTKETVDRKQHPEYSLEYILQVEKGERESSFPLYYSQRTILDIATGGPVEEPTGSMDVWHDISMKKWRLTIQLEPDRWWFLSVYYLETGEFDRFYLDYEAADDEHYMFKDEEKLRKVLYKKGDEKLYLHEIMIRYIHETGKGYGIKGGCALLRKIPVLERYCY